MRLRARGLSVAWVAVPDPTTVQAELRSEKRELKTQVNTEEIQLLNAKNVEERLRKERENLRKERDDYKDWYGQIYEQFEAVELERDMLRAEEESAEAEANAYKNVAESKAASFGSSSKPKISRKEAENFPKINDLDIWKVNVSQAVVVASGDDDVDAWTRWLAPAMVADPDLDALSDSGDIRFQSIDAKLGIALTAIVQNGGEAAREVAMKVRQRTQARSKTSSFVKGREVLAMIVTNFRTTSYTEMMFNVQNLYSLKYPGDKQIGRFLAAWEEILANMRPSDIPSEVTLRDCIHKKIRDSQLMRFDLSKYEGLREGQGGQDEIREVSTSTQPTVSRFPQETARFEFPELGMACAPYVLSETPSVISVGKKCMKEGYSKLPFMINESEQKIDLMVKDDIPYIEMNSDECTPTTDERIRMISRLLQMDEKQWN
ncbi:unnamed protein product [Durusdinium trenchii]|uniref:Uncharacterized protein n=1 Tax=Durusdinium trenchii TaxID=1381693 RepID=A0ABP0N798_9DINO